MMYDNELIKKKRKEKFSYIHDFASYIGISHITILKCEHGECVSLTSLEKICKGLGIEELTIKFN